MFKRLLAFLSRAPAPTPAPATAPAAVDDVSDVDEDARLIEQAAVYRSAMPPFMDVVAGHLPADERERLTSSILAQFDDDEDEMGGDRETVGELFFEAMFGDEGQHHDQRLMISVDWKASDQIDWQANDILALHGIDDEWQWEYDGKTVMEGMAALSAWLKRHALALLSIDFGHDAYHMFIVTEDIAPQAVALGQRAGLNVLSFPDFAVTQGA